MRSTCREAATFAWPAPPIRVLASFLAKCREPYTESLDVQSLNASSPSKKISYNKFELSEKQLKVFS